MKEITQLKDALMVLNSLRYKCQKSQEKIAHRPSQYTLLQNRIQALDIALELIQDKLSEHS